MRVRYLTVRFFNLINVSFSGPNDILFFSLMHVIKGEFYSDLENQIMWHWLVDKIILKEVTLLNAHPSLPIQAYKPWPYRFEVLDNHIGGETGLSFIISPLNALGRISSLHHKVMIWKGQPYAYWLPCWLLMSLTQRMSLSLFFFF